MKNQGYPAQAAIALLLSGEIKKVREADSPV